MLSWMVPLGAVGAFILRKLLPARWNQVLSVVVFWCFAAIAAGFAGLAVWTASGITSGQMFWMILAGVQIGGAVVFLAMGRAFQRLLVA